MRCPFQNFAPCLQGECAAYEPEKRVSNNLSIPEYCNMFSNPNMVVPLPYSDKTRAAIEKMGANAHGGLIKGNICVCCGEIIPECRMVCPNCDKKGGCEETELLYGSSPCTNLPTRKGSRE